MIDHMIFTILGIISAILFVIADSIYIRDIFRGTTKPQRMGWGIGAIMNIIAFANQMASGATDSLWIFGAAAVMVSAIFLLSLRYGVGGTGKADLIALGVSIVGVVLWIVFSDPLLSVIGTLVSFISIMSLNFAKAKVDPDSETLSTWLLAAVSSGFASVAVGSLSIDLLLLPVGGVVLQAYMGYLIWKYRNLNQKSSTT